MINYNLIQNTELRLLVTASESIHTLEEAQIQNWVERIAKLPPDGEKQMILALRDEQLMIRKSKAARGITPEKELAQIQEKLEKVHEIKRNFETAVRVEEESVDQAKVEANADNILNSI